MSPRVVAEAGQCHGGSVAVAIALARAAADAGAWGVKYQFLNPAKLATADAPLYWANTLGKTTQREAFTDAGMLDAGGWAEVRAACYEFGIAFGSTPFDLDAVVLLASLEPDFVKVASGDLTHRDLLLAVGDIGVPVMVSTGAAYEHEIARADAWLANRDVTLFACQLAYPTPLDQAHLARIETLRARFPLRPVGLSDHTSNPSSALAAAAMGAEVLEVHFSLGAANVADTAMACDRLALAEYVKAAEVGGRLRGYGTLVPTVLEQAARHGARRGVYALRDLAAGETVKAGDVEYLRPWLEGGMEPWEAVGVVCPRDIKVGEAL